MQIHRAVWRGGSVMTVLVLLGLTACGTPTAAQPASAATTAASPTTLPAATAAPQPTVETEPGDISQLSDEFDDPANLKRWVDLAAVEGWPNWIEQTDVDTTAPGQLYLVPKASGWYEDYRGVFLFQEVSGDFDVTTRIRTTGKGHDLPTMLFSLSGLMARTPRQETAENWTLGRENWVFITNGYGDQHPSRVGKPQIETKTTVNSRSSLVLRKSQNDWVELRMVRVGPTMLMMYRFTGEDWKISRIYNRPDMPQTLQVGLNAYSSDNVQGDPYQYNLRTDPPPGDLVVRVEYVRFQRPQIGEAYLTMIAEQTMKNSDWVAAVGEAASAE